MTQECFDALERQDKINDNEFYAILDETTIDNALSETSTNPVQNKVITEKLNEKQNSIILSANKPSDEVPVGTMWFNASEATIAYAEEVAF